MISYCEQRYYSFTYLVEFGALLLEFLILVSDNLAFLFELVTEQILQVLPQVNHLTGSELWFNVIQLIVMLIVHKIAHSSPRGFIVLCRRSICQLIC